MRRSQRDRGQRLDHGIGRSLIRNFWAIVARTSVASIWAKLLPMQSLGPPPNGKYA